MLSKSSSNPNAWIFFAAGVKLFLKNVLIVVAPVLVSEYVYDPSYDLKFIEIIITFVPT